MAKQILSSIPHHGLVVAPGQIRTKDDGEVGGGHLIHVAPVDHQRDELHQELEDHVVLVRQALDYQVLQQTLEIITNTAN